MDENQLSPDEQRALEAIIKDHAVARFMAPNFMRHLESLGLVERVNSVVVISEEGRQRARALRSHSE